MEVVADGGVPLWASTEFWIGLPLAVFVITFQIVVLVAVIRARPEDIPKVLAIFIAIAGRRSLRTSGEIESITAGASREPRGVCGGLNDGREP
jgi:hypothetical protein